MSVIPPPPARATEQPPTAGEKFRAGLRRLVPERDDWIDGGFTIVVMALVLVGLRTTYHGWAWALAGVAGLLLGLWNAHLTRSYRLPAIVLAALLAVTYLLWGGPFAVRDHVIAGFVPSGRTFGDLIHEVVSGWKELLTSLPPVDSRGPHMAIPFLIGLVGAAAVYAVARRFTQVAVALVAPLLLLGFIIAMGTATPSAQLAQGAAYGLVLIVWAAVRAGRNRAALQNGAGRVARGVTALLLLCVATAGGALIGPRLPGSEATQQRTVWRNGLIAPFDVSQFASPLAGYRKYTEPNPQELWNRTLLQVDGLPKGTPLRFATLDSYDGSVWGAGNVAADSQTGPTQGAAPGGGASSFQKVGSHIDNPAQGQTATVKITVPAQGWSDVWMPTVGTVQGISFDGGNVEALREQLRFNVATNTGVIPARLAPGDTYTMEVVLPEVSERLPQDLATANGSIVEVGPLSYFDAKLDAWSGKAGSQWQRVLAVAAQMRTAGAYTDGGPAGSYQNTFLPGHSVSRMSRFIKSEQLAGNDEQYAAALSLAANRLGVPARVVVGAISDGSGAIKGKDVHAWVEVQTAGGRWQPVLPKDFVPDRNKQPNQQQRTSEEKRIGAQIPPPGAQNPPSVHQGPDQAQIAVQNPPKPPKKNFLDPSTWPDWLRWLVVILGVPLLVFLVVWGSMRLAKLLRAHRRRTRGDTVDQVGWGWREVVDQARDLRIAVPHEATRLEQAAAMGAAGAIGGRTGRRAAARATAQRDAEQAAREAAVSGEALTRQVAQALQRDAGREARLAQASEQVLVPLAARANAAVFGEGEPTSQQVDTFWAEIKQARRALRSRRSFLGRLRADLSLASFLEERRMRRELRAADRARRADLRNRGTGDGQQFTLGPGRRGPRPAKSRA